MIDFQERKEKVAERCIELMQERSGQYSHTGEDHIHAKIMLLLFPDGIKGTFAHFARYKELSFIIEKICRYTANFNEEDFGHEDSVMDLICFGVMLAAVDQMLKEKKEALR